MKRLSHSLPKPITASKLQGWEPCCCVTLQLSAPDFWKVLYCLENILSVEYIIDQISCHLFSTQYKPDVELSTFTHTISNACEPNTILQVRKLRPRDLTWLSPLGKASQSSVQVRQGSHSFSSGCLCAHLCVCMLSHLSCVRLFATHSTAAGQAPLSMGFSRQEYWSELPRPSPGDVPDPGIKPASLKSPALAVRFFITSATWGALCSSGYLEYYYLFRVFYVLSFLDGQANYLLSQNT